MSFPNEILLQILDHLDVETLLECRRINNQYMEAADKVLFDRRLIAVELHVERTKDAVFWNDQRIREIEASTIHAFLRRISRLTIETIDYMPPFMIVDRLIVDVPSVTPLRVNEITRIIRFLGVKQLRHVTILAKTRHLHENVILLMKLLKNAPLTSLEFKWNWGGYSEDNARSRDACIQFFKAVAPHISKHIEIKGPFSIAEFIECFTLQSGFKYINLPSFLAFRSRMHAGDGPSAVLGLLEHIKENPRRCTLEFKGQQGNIDWTGYIAKIQDKYAEFHEIYLNQFIIPLTVDGKRWHLEVRFNYYRIEFTCLYLGMCADTQVVP
ncbi:hypothetical protein L596_022890 [Steinernema carpocapsae]|uniref:F-box domain-containing protein n=1 Tax=Steinernema carpocapsae TaxID=34508 RepID=A0A4U5MBV8_STECR|nr:hypothetical protein L596_022890 [Steinernema carpocapsae]